jgi:transcriptional regulator with XRE-family HTH domain
MVAAPGADGGGVPRLTLGGMLQKARLDAGMTQKAAAEAIDMSAPNLGRIEGGQSAAKLSAVRDLCRLYNVGPEDAEVMEALARESKARGWWASYGAVIPGYFDMYMRLESGATRLRWYESEVVPGLLQSPDYARVLITQNDPDAEDEVIEGRVELRTGRQRLLLEQRVQLTAVLNQAILERPVGGPALMAGQLQYLLDTFVDLPNVSIHVVPFDVGYHDGILSGPFELMDFPARTANNGTPLPPAPTTVYTEDPAGAVYLDRPKEVGPFEQKWVNILKSSLDKKASKDFIARRAKEMR